MTSGARRRLIIVGVATFIVLLLVGGRWAAVETAERAWAATVSGGDVYAEARDVERLVKGVVLLAAALWGTVQLYLVYRAIGSVQVPRRLGNIEIVETVPQRLLLGLALGAGVLYGWLLTLGTGDWWLLVSLASRAPVFGTADPVLGRDAGYFVATLPWLSALQDRAVLAALSALIVVGLLYFGMGALRFEGLRPTAGSHTRSHMGTLLATLALALAWGAALDAAEVVAGASGPLDHAALSVRVPGSTVLVIGAMILSALSLAWALNGRPAIMPGAWGAFVLGQLVIYVLAPEVVRAGADRGRRSTVPVAAVAPEAAVGSRSVAGSRNGRIEPVRAGLERLAFGLEALREEALPAFASPIVAATVFPLWDHERVELVARQTVGSSLRTDGAPAVSALYRPASSREPARWLITLAPDPGQWPRLTSDVAWDEIHRGRFARAGPPVIAAESDSGLVFQQAPVRDSITWFGTGFTEFGIASGATAPRSAGIPLDGWWRRAALAWALQSPELLDSRPDEQLVWRRSPRERLIRLLPPVRFDPPVPAIAGGSLWWISYGYVESDRFPAVLPRVIGGMEYRYLRLGFVGTVQAASGETHIYLAPGHDSLSAAWARIFEPLARPTEEIPAAISAALSFPQRMFDVGAAHVIEAERDTAAWQPRPGESFIVPAPPPAVGLWMGQAFETARPPAFVAMLAGRMTPAGPDLVLWRPATPMPRPLSLVGSAETKPGVLRLWPVESEPGRRAGGGSRHEVGVFSAQAQFLGDIPVPARVYVSLGELRGEGPAALAAVRDMLARSPADAADTALTIRWQRARRLAAQADSALSRGDLREFGRLYEELKHVLNVGRPKLAPLPRPR